MQFDQKIRIAFCLLDNRVAAAFDFIERTFNNVKALLRTAMLSSVLRFHAVMLAF